MDMQHVVTRNYLDLLAFFVIKNFNVILTYIPSINENSKFKNIEYVPKITKRIEYERYVK